MLKWMKKFFNYTPSSPTNEIIDGVTSTPNYLGGKPKKVMSKKKLGAMTKQQLESMGRDEGIELDRRLTKSKLVDQLHKHLKS
jgi:hypothetical protein|tara:strand:- start:25 stop:273 length:249 start_codon:yes stop_codon:yes gene_type:complete